MEGYLEKRAIRTGKNWKTRYFVLDNKKLCYYKSKTNSDTKPRGEMVIYATTNVTESKLRPFCFEISNNDTQQLLIVATKTQDEYEQWLEALARTVAKARERLSSSVMMSDDEMEENESKTNSVGSSSGGGFFKRFSVSGVMRKHGQAFECSNSSQQNKRLNEEMPKRRETHQFNTPTTRFEVDKRYSFIRPIGTGAYGVVVSAIDEETKTKVAIKKVTKAFSDLVDAKRILREIKLLRHFDHENIIHIKDLLPPKQYNNFDDIYIVSELMETDLHRVVYSKQKLTEDHIQYFVYQILRALRYIHSANVIHRDLKPSNLLLNANCDLKVCDFGLARGLEDTELQLTEYVVTRWYRAPEIMLACRKYTKAIDVWSVGCIFAELLARKPLFPGEDYIHQLELIIKFIGTPSEEDIQFVTSQKAKKFMMNQRLYKRKDFSKCFPRASEEAIDLLNKMLVFNPEKRISVNDALAHPFLSSLHQPEDEPEHHEFFEFDESVSDDDLQKSELQRQILEEVFHFHPNERRFMEAQKQKGGQSRKLMSRQSMFSR